MRTRTKANKKEKENQAKAIYIYIYIYFNHFFTDALSFSKSCSLDCIRTWGPALDWVHNGNHLQILQDWIWLEFVRFVKMRMCCLSFSTIWKLTVFVLLSYRNWLWYLICHDETEFGWSWYKKNFLNQLVCILVCFFGFWKICWEESEKCHYSFSCLGLF